MKKFQPWFYFVDTEEEAVMACEAENSRGTYYKRKHHPAHYTPWTSADGKERKFIVWTVA